MECSCSSTEAPITAAIKDRATITLEKKPYLL